MVFQNRPGGGKIPFYEYVLWGIGILFILEAKVTNSQNPEVYSQAAVATDAPLCADVGKDILQRDGSAVDAAIATLLCMGVVNMHSSGIGGGFLMTIYNSSTGTAEVLDAREIAPAAATQNMFAGEDASSLLGGLSVAVPGEVKGYHEAYKRYGKLPWRDLFQAAIQKCNDGFPVGRDLAAAIQYEKTNILSRSDIRSLLFNDATNDVYKEGEILRNVKLGITLDEIARRGYRAFYNGTITSDIVNEIQNDGGILTVGDFLGYRAKWKQSIAVNIGVGTLHSVPLPGSGSILGFIINVLRKYIPNVGPLNGPGSVLTYHRIAEAFKYAYAMRMGLGDVDTPEVRTILQNLNSDSYISAIKNLIDDSRTFSEPSHYLDRVSTTWDHGTAHVSVVASNGDAVAATSSVNHLFGSKLFSTTSGVIFNNQMDDFSSPNEVNGYNYPPSATNYIEPRKRPMSSMNPSIIVDSSSNVKMVIGGIGGSKITSGTALVILRSLFYNENIRQAIEAPRIHHQLIPNQITYQNEFNSDVLEGLRARGHQTAVTVGPDSIIVGIVKQSNGALAANSDYRKGGGTSGF